MTIIFFKVVLMVGPTLMKQTDVTRDLNKQVKGTVCMEIIYFDSKNVFCKLKKQSN